MTNSIEEARDEAMRSTAAHIRRVGWLLVDCSAILSRRAVIHDESKWSEKEWPYFARMTLHLKGITYGSPEYRGACAELKPALDHHYDNNPHHPEYYERKHPGVVDVQPDIGISQMDLFDLMEMLCDWKAATERHADGSIAKSLDINRRRFCIGEQLFGILRNTARCLDWIDEPAKEAP